MNRALGWSRSTWALIIRHPYTVLAVLILIPLSLAFLLRKDSEFHYVYLQAARHLWRGNDIYRKADAYLYPPFMAYATTPFLALPGKLVRPAWLLVNLVCLVFVLRGAWRLAAGPALENAKASRGEHLAVFLGCLCGICYLQNSWAHQQTDIVIAALLVGGGLYLVRGRDLAAATCFGLAAACKCTPLLLAPYLLWRRRPAAAALLVVVAVSVNLLPDLVNQPTSGRLWLAEYGARYLEPLTNRNHYAGSWGSEIVYNQSLAGAGQRWLATTWHWEVEDVTLTLQPERVSPLVLRGAVYGACLLVLIGSVVACGRVWQRLDPADQLPGGISRLAVELSVLFLLMLLLSPMSSKAHFGILLLPGYCLARVAVRTGRRDLWALLVLAVLLALVGNNDLVGDRLYTLTLWCGNTTWQAVVLLLGCWLLLNLKGEAGSATGAQGPPLRKAA